jgi:hypothetical protein
MNRFTFYQLQILLLFWESERLQNNGTAFSTGHSTLKCEAIKSITREERCHKFVAEISEQPNSLAHSRTVTICIPGRDVPLHHHRFDGATIVSGF